MFSLIIPVYRNEDSIPDLLDAVETIGAAVPDGFEAVFVVDGSPDRCYELLRDVLPVRGFRSQLLLLSRNFGPFAAVRAGLEIAAGDRFAIMAADLQEPPELAVEMDAKLRADEADVIIGVRDGRDDPAATRLPAELFWSIYRRWVVPEMPPGGVDVFACNRAFRDQLLRLDERHSSLIAQLFWVGFRRAYVHYHRREREHGTSAWTLRKRFGYLSDSVFSFTDLPIKALIWVGGIVAILSGLYGAIVVVMRLFGAIDVPGFTVTLLAIVFFGSLNLYALGIIGSYAWRAYENTKARPLHIVHRTHVFPEVEPTR